METAIKSINNVINGVATIRIYEQIGNTYEGDKVTYGVSGNHVADMIEMYNEQKVDRIDLRINSIGGNVFEGYSIISAILSSKTPVHTFIDGLAASIAGVIALTGVKCCMYDYSTLMLHNPFGKGVNDDVLSYIKGTLVKIISNRSKRTQEEVAFMMDGETWLNATDAHKMGFVDEIISSAKPFKIEESNRKNLYNLVTIYNQLITEQSNPNKNKMDEITKIQNKLDSANSELETLKAEKAALEAEKATLTAEKADLSAKVDAINVEKEAALAAEATTVVENAIKEGKIAADSKESYVKMAKMDLATVKNSLAAIQVKVKKAPENILNATKKVENKAGDKNADRSDWTIRDWEKKDAKGLENMYKENRPAYVELYNAHYATKIQ